MPFFGPNLRIEAGRVAGVGDEFGEFGEYFDSIFRRDWFDPGVVPLGRRAPAIRSPVGIAAPDIFPTVVVQSPTETEESVRTESVGPPTVDISEEVIDPDYRPEYQVSEREMRGPLIEFPNPFQNTRDTDWDAVYDQYVELNEEVEPVAVDWGDIARSAIGGIAGGLLDPVGIGSYTQGFFPGPTGLPTPVAGPPSQTAVVPQLGGGDMACGPTGPRYAKVCLATGAVTPLRRRRRRRLLTSSDLADLASLKAIVGGGAAMNSAVVKAVRR